MLPLNLPPTGRRTRWSTPLTVLVAVLLSCTGAGASANDTCTADRIVGVARLWSAVRWHHPHLAQRAIDWDKALAESLPKLCSAGNARELAAAIDTLMHPLQDPLYRTTTASPFQGVRTGASTADWPLEWLPDNVALLHLHQGTVWSTGEGRPNARLQAAITRVGARATGLVIDLRPVNAHEVIDAAALEAVLAHVIDTELHMPGQRTVLKADFQFDAVTHIGGRRSGLFTAQSRLLQPATQTRGLPLALLVDGDTRLPAVVLALDKRQLAHVLRVGTALPRVGVTRRVPVSADLAAEFTVGDHVFDDNTAVAGIVGNALQADTLSSARSPSVMAAVQRLSAPPAPTLAYAQVRATLPARQADGRRDMKPPELTWRRVAAIKYWSTADAVVPADQRIPHVQAEDALVRTFTAMTDAQTPAAYIDALSGFTVALADTHAELMGRLAWDRFGLAEVPIRLKRVEGKVLVVEVTQGTQPRKGTLRAGDEVLQLDGVPIAAALKLMLPLVGGSTDAARERNVLRRLLKGTVGTVLTMDVTDASGATRVAEMVRSPLPTKEPAGPPGPHHRRLSEHIGYIDLVHLNPDQVDAAFDALGSCSGLIVDLRGYPKGAAWALAKRLNATDGARGPIFNQPIVGAFGPAQDMSQLERMGTSGPSKPPYAGKVVVLTDIEGQSQTEHSVLLLEAAAPITVVGEPTSGTNGHVAVDVLPGNVHATFGTMDVRHADGTRLQRVGIQPHVLVRQTLEGVRQGRDEQLDAAVTLLTEGARK